MIGQLVDIKTGVCCDRRYRDEDLGLRRPWRDQQTSTFDVSLGQMFHRFMGSLVTPPRASPDSYDQSRMVSDGVRQSEATMRRVIVGLFIALGVLSGAPLPLEAEEATKIIGVFFGGVSRDVPWMQSFLDGLRDQGYVEGQNMRIEFRSAEGYFERLPSLAAELVALKPDVILSSTAQTTE